MFGYYCSMNILEKCLKDLLNQKTLLEGRLELLVNDPLMSTELKFNKTMDLLKEISDLQNLIGLTTVYITQNKNEEKE